MDTPEQPKKRGSRAGFWVAILLLLFLLLLSLAANFGLFIGMSVMGGSREPRTHAQDEFPRLGEVWSFGSGDVKAARIPVAGVITRQKSQGFFDSENYDPVETVIRQVRAAMNDETVRAIILEIDSPGGDITSTDEIYEALMDFKRSAGDRRIIAFVRGLAASGGYYVAMAADWIVAEPTAIVGSISVIMQTLNWKELSDKVGVTDVTIKTGGNKDMLNPFREVQPEHLALLQEMVDAMHLHFIGIVVDGRGIDPELLSTLADGRIFTTGQALDHDLVDQSGYWQAALEKTSELLGEESVTVVRYEEKTSFFQRFSQIQTTFSPAAFFDVQRPRLMYLWRP